MSWIIFNGKHSAEMNVDIIRIPPITRAPMRYELQKVDGRHGADVNCYGYDMYEKTIDIFVEDPSNINEIICWLSGHGKLVLSNEKDKYYIAYAVGQLDFGSIARCKSAKVTFLVQPFKYTQEEYTIANTVYNRGNTDSMPLMEIYGSGEVKLYINNMYVCTVNVSESIILDSEKQEAYQGSVIKNRQMKGEFPVFTPGANHITWTGNVTQIKTLVRSRWL